MHNYCKTIGALAAVSALVAGNAMANVEYELGTGYTNEYIFRGINRGEDLVEASAAVKGQWEGFRLSGGAWYGSFDNRVSMDELDLWGDIGWDFGNFQIATGYIYRYTTWGVDDSFFPNLEDWDGEYRDRDDSYGTQEIYAGAGFDFWGWQTSLTYYWAIEGDNDGYTELASKYEWVFPNHDCLSIGIVSRLGFLVEEGDFTHWSNRLSFNWGFAERARLSPFVQYDLALSEGGANYNGSLANYADSKNEFTGGCMLTVTF